jgi:hypothetical protein
MLTAAAGSIDITPESSCELAGYSIPRRYKDISDPLEMNALILKDEGESVLFMTADLLYVTSEIKEEVWLKSGIYKIIDKDAFLFGASHTHFAPAVDREKPGLGKASEEYINLVIDRSVELLKQLFESQPEPVTLTYSEGKCDHSVNRRRMDWIVTREKLPRIKKTAQMAPNFKGKKDETLRALTIKKNDGTLLAVVWNYACHPTAFPQIHSVSADFPGVCRNVLRKAMVGSCKPLPVLFYQGFSGDIRPRSILSKYPKNIAGIKHAIKAFINGPYFKLFLLEEYMEWSNSLAGVLVRTVAAHGETVRAESIECVSASILLSEILDGYAAEKFLTIRHIQLSSNFHFVAISAEVVVEYVDIVKAIWGTSTVIPVGCIDTTYGYLPTIELVSEGGYECKGFMKLFGITSCFNSQLENTLMSRLRYLRKSSMR